MSYNTNFDTANNRMEHDFGNGNLVIVDFNQNRLFKLHNGDVKEHFSIKGMLLETYAKILANIEKSF
ncbi:MAG: hypothetical protein WCH34_18275 [Bacteroidota bacterium]